MAVVYIRQVGGLDKRKWPVHMARCAVGKVVVLLYDDSLIIDAPEHRHA
ncbi:MAG: hypothetical protein IT324_23830 [Anaerolineae bacterium]|nr:hypothetical protein [Anaerolineae bacterium]